MLRSQSHHHDDPSTPASNSTTQEEASNIPTFPVAGAGTSDVAGDNDQPETADRDRVFIWYRAVPAWLISTLVHVLVIVILALITIGQPVPTVTVLSANTNPEQAPEIEEFSIEVEDPGEISDPQEVADPVDVEQSLEITSPAEVTPMEMVSVDIPMMDVASEMAATDSTLRTLSQVSMQPLSSRSSEMKQKLLREYGGTEASEAAVAEALKWLARHQMPNGAWTFQHNLVCNGACGDPGEPKRASAYNAATALALLPFMGAGQTHLEGKYRATVFRGLHFLITNGKAGRKGGQALLDLREGPGNMYSHGLAAIALCEAYAMTGDPDLAGPAQAALNFIVYAQCRDGGWRYQPQQKDGGDTSVTGWQVMALKSGYMGHLSVPTRSVQGTMLFLDKVQNNNGATYGYKGPDTRLRPSTTAIGLLCRMYIGWDRTHPGIVQGVKKLGEVGVLKNDIYYDYYAAQVLRHYGGKEWDAFNKELREWLVRSQSQEREAKGSWHFPNSLRHRGPREGGRLFSTAMATMILEVYYRYMPLYAEAAAEEEFPL